MWPAIEELIRRGEERGRIEGEERGRIEGEARGEARGRIEGEARGRIEGEARGRMEGEARGRIEGEARGIEKGLIEAQNVAIANTIQYHLQKQDTVDSIVKMLTCIFHLSSDEAEKRIQQVVKA